MKTEELQALRNSIEVHWSSESKGDHEEAERILAEVGNLGAELDQVKVTLIEPNRAKHHNVDSNLPDAEVPDAKMKTTTKSLLT